MLQIKKKNIVYFLYDFFDKKWLTEDSNYDMITNVESKGAVIREYVQSLFSYLLGENSNLSIFFYSRKYNKDAQLIVL